MLFNVSIEQGRMNIKGQKKQKKISLVQRKILSYFLMMVIFQIYAFSHEGST